MKNITGVTSVLYGIGSRRYKPGAQAFHWVTALLIFIVVPVGLIFSEYKETPGSRDAYVSVHKTLGLVIFAIVIARIVYRLMNRPPALPGRMADWERLLSHASHWLLYAVLIVMPVSGYIMASASSHPISILGLFDFPQLPISKDVGENAEAIHIYFQWALYVLVILHIAATAFHLVARRDAILDRMLPRQANAE